MLVRKRQAVQVFYFLEGLVALDDAADAAEDAGDFCPIAAGCQGFQESRYHLFPFTLEDVINMLMIFQYLPGRIGYFRAADEDLGLWKDLFHQVDEMTGHFDIPDIAGKADDVGRERGDVAQDVIAVLIDRIFGTDTATPWWSHAVDRQRRARDDWMNLEFKMVSSVFMKASL